MEVKRTQHPKESHGVSPAKGHGTTHLGKTHVVRVGNHLVGDGHFTVIAGPCSIENPSQFQETVEGVKAEGAHLLRGGIWKMRTSYQSFQGVGRDGFEFIRDTCRNNGMSLVSEITDPRQIEEVYDVVEMFQVGSRNMHNYALLKELGKQKKPVLLKRGFAALIDEWLKSAEYLVAGGNDNVILCERGIRTFETAMRNTLDLNAVAYVKQYSSYPVIVDPSHAVGIRDLVPQLALASAAVGADGIIVEVHPRPAEALSDGMQALTLGDFKEMMIKLKKIAEVVGLPFAPIDNAEGSSR